VHDLLSLVVTRRRLRLIAISGTLSLLALLSVLAVLARLQSGQSNSASDVPAPLAVGTELQRPRLVPHVQKLKSKRK
jgi:hypothetical protein